MLAAASSTLLRLLGFQRQPTVEAGDGRSIIVPARGATAFYGYRGVAKRLTDISFAVLILLLTLPLFVLVMAAGGLAYSGYHIAQLQQQIGVARQLGQYRLTQRIGAGDDAHSRRAESRARHA